MGAGSGTGEESYTSFFDRWDDQAWVRKGERRLAPFDSHKDFFSRALTPLLLHPEAASWSEDVIHRCLVHALYNYLEFTVRLEMGPVNEVCKLLSSPSFLGFLPRQMKDDALKIYTDEAGHAQMSAELRQRVISHTRVQPIRSEPAFLRQLVEIQAAQPDTFRQTTLTFFVIVSETLITGSLSKLPRDETVQTAVREMARDHAKDEGRHHAYFRDLLRHIWPVMPKPLQVEVAMMVPHLLLAFLGVDIIATAAMAADAGLGTSQARDLAEVVANLDATKQSIVVGAQPSIRIFADVGMFDLPGVTERFISLGLPMG